MSDADVAAVPDPIAVSVISDYSLPTGEVSSVASDADVAAAGLDPWSGVVGVGMAEASAVDGRVSGPDARGSDSSDVDGEVTMVMCIWRSACVGCAEVVVGSSGCRSCAMGAAEYGCGEGILPGPFIVNATADVSLRAFD